MQLIGANPGQACDHDWQRTSNHSGGNIQKLEPDARRVVECSSQALASQHEGKSRAKGRGSAVFAEIPADAVILSRNEAGGGCGVELGHSHCSLNLRGHSEDCLGDAVRVL